MEAFQEDAELDPIGTFYCTMLFWRTGSLNPQSKHILADVGFFADMVPAFVRLCYSWNFHGAVIIGSGHKK
jgi:hypothetical protein